MQYVICMYSPILGQEHFEYRGLITSNKGLMCMTMKANSKYQTYNMQLYGVLQLIK